MPLIALESRTGRRICSLDFNDAHQVRSQFKKGDLVCCCHDCEIPVFPRQREGFILHFVHSKPCETKMKFHPESIEHLEGKKLVKNFLSEQLSLYSSAEILLEMQLPHAGKNGRIADIAIHYPSGWLEIHEIQLASITVEELEARTRDYASIGADVFWWLGKSAYTQENRDWCIAATGSVYQLLFDYKPNS